MLPPLSFILFQIALEAFGKRFDLELNRNLNLVPGHRKLNVFFADRGKEEINYDRDQTEVSAVPTTFQALLMNPAIGGAQVFTELFDQTFVGCQQYHLLCC